MQWYCALKCHKEPIRSTDVLEWERVVSSMTSLSGLVDIISHFTPFWTFSCFRFSIFAHRKSAWWIVKLPVFAKYWNVKWTCNVNLVQMFQYTCEIFFFFLYNKNKLMLRMKKIRFEIVDKPVGFLQIWEYFSDVSWRRSFIKLRLLCV